MNIDPKQIAKMITEDPNEVNPLDDIEDRFLPACDICGDEDTNILRMFEAGDLPEDRDEVDDYSTLHRCDMCRDIQICDACIARHGSYDEQFDMLICPNCKKSDEYRESLRKLVWSRIG